MDPQPADFAVVSMRGRGGVLISVLEEIAYRHATWWDHTFIYLGNGMIAQAEPRGARIAHLGTYDHAIWSTGILYPTAAQRQGICEAARRYTAAHVGYSYLDYAAIGAHRFHIPVPGLREFIGDIGRMICSQMTDQCWADGGFQLFDDRRWPGYVTPYDLGTLLQQAAAGQAL